MSWTASLTFPGTSHAHDGEQTGNQRRPVLGEPAGRAAGCGGHVSGTGRGEPLTGEAFLDEAARDLGHLNGDGGRARCRSRARAASASHRRAFINRPLACSTVARAVTASSSRDAVRRESSYRDRVNQGYPADGGQQGRQRHSCRVKGLWSRPVQGQGDQQVTRTVHERSRSSGHPGKAPLPHTLATARRHLARPVRPACQRSAPARRYAPHRIPGRCPGQLPVQQDREVRMARRRGVQLAAAPQCGRHRPRTPGTV